MKPLLLTSKFLGGMVGCGLGDAIGEMAFDHPREDDLWSAIELARQLIYTDDTAMAIGLAESVVQVGEVASQHLGDTFRANFRREPWRGYASGPPTIFSLVERTGLPYAEVAHSLFGGQGSLGNGAAMRIVPLGLAFHDSPDLYEQARESASVTHAHPLGVDGAAVLAWAVAQAVQLDPRADFPHQTFAQALAGFARTAEIRDKIALASALAQQAIPPSQAANRLGKSVAVHESLPFAIYCFLRHTDSFEACLSCAVLHGGDRDTLGAMAGGLSGAYVGIEALPQVWRNKLENGQHIETLARALAEVSHRRAAAGKE